MPGCLFPIRRWSVKSWAELRYHHHRRQSFGPATTPLASRLSADFVQKSIAWLTSRCSPLPSSLTDFPLLLFFFFDNASPEKRSCLGFTSCSEEFCTRQTRPNTGSARKLMFWVSGILFIYTHRFFGLSRGTVRLTQLVFRNSTQRHLSTRKRPRMRTPPPQRNPFTSCFFLLASVTVQSIVSIEQRVLVKTAVSWCVWCVSSEKQKVGGGHSTRHCICAGICASEAPPTIYDPVFRENP